MWHNISVWVLNVNPIIYKIVEKEHCCVQVIILMLVSGFLRVLWHSLPEQCFIFCVLKVSYDFV
jgi:hypothetical protein